MNVEQRGGGNGAETSLTTLAAVAVKGNRCGKLHSSITLAKCCLRDQSLMWGVTIDYLYGASFLLIHTTQRMFPLGLCQYLEDRYVFSLGPCCFSFAPFPQDIPTPVPLLLFTS